MIPQYEFFQLPPSAFAVDPATAPLPRWLMLSIAAAGTLIICVGAALG